MRELDDREAAFATTIDRLDADDLHGPLSVRERNLTYEYR